MKYYLLFFVLNKMKHIILNCLKIETCAKKIILIVE